MHLCVIFVGTSDVGGYQRDVWNEEEKQSRCILIALLAFQGQGNSTELFTEGTLEGTHGTHAIRMENEF